MVGRSGGGMGDVGALVVRMTDPATGTLTEEQRERRLNRLFRVAMVSFGCMIVFGIALAFLGLYDDAFAKRIGDMASFIVSVYLSFAALVGTWMGANVAMSAGKK